MALNFNTNTNGALLLNKNLAVNFKQPLILICILCIFKTNTFPSFLKKILS